jgi:chloramphenicol O-acetyltransferase
LAAAYKITIIFIFLLVLPGVNLAEEHVKPEDCEIIIDDFNNGIDPGWTKKSFTGETQYSVAQDGDQPYLRATSNGTASALYYKIEYDPREYPYIAWKWKVDNIIEKGDATKKSGDDYAARLFIVFPSSFFVSTETLNYIWATRLQKDFSVPCPYMENSIMVSVQSGHAKIGKWLAESRNIYEDYKKHFGKQPEKVGAIAIMTDTDDTQERASASYGTIAICRTDPQK